MAAQPHAEKAAPWLFPGSNPPSHIPGNASTAPSRGQGQNSPVSRDPPPSGAAAASGESPSSSPIPLLVLEGRGAALVSTPWFFITAFPPSQTLQKQKGSDFKDIWRILGVISPGWEGACSRQELCAEESIAWPPVCVRITPIPAVESWDPLLEQGSTSQPTDNRIFPPGTTP